MNEAGVGNPGIGGRPLLSAPLNEAGSPHDLLYADKGGFPAESAKCLSGLAQFPIVRDPKTARR